MAREISIHSDGTGTGTTILTDDGKPLSNVLNAHVYMEGNERNRVTLEVQSVSVNAQADVTEVWFVCPLCDETTTHVCDSSVSGNVIHKCANTFHIPDDNSITNCIRGNGHGGKHFDGENVWD